MEFGVRVSTPKKYEPKIEELLEDPIILALLKRDGLTIEDVKEVISAYQNSQSLKPVTYN
jgi:hypothetical protein